MVLNPQSLFKPAKANSNLRNLSKTLIQMIIFWLVFLFVFPQIILKLEVLAQIPGFSSWTISGSVLLVLFSSLGVYSGYTMSWLGKGTPLPLDCPNNLVIAGPYRFVRNPMAVAGIGQGICVGLILGSYAVILYAMVGALLWHFFVRPSEEKDLEQRFGESYIAYKSKVTCWIPTFINDSESRD